MDVSMENVRQLREKTGAGIMDCKKALLESSGDVEKASEWLRKKGLATALKKASRATKEGCIHSYIHAGGKIGVLVEVNCETDFVARTDEFQGFIRDVAMHIAATNPQFVSRDQVSTDVIEKEKEVFSAQAKESGKPLNVIEKIVEGKMDRFLSEICLIEQPFVKDPDKAIKDIITALVAKLGENITIARFARFQLGETLQPSQDMDQE
ncbi:MAG: translation elongation factor Ts [Bdellovibrionales bacterium]|nr:translation elongation factor Ts [Bdellovibrionales bacterium]